MSDDAKILPIDRDEKPVGLIPLVGYYVLGRSYRVSGIGLAGAIFAAIPAIEDAAERGFTHKTVLGIVSALLIYALGRTAKDDKATGLPR